MRQWLFIADLHLAPERPKIIDLFVRFVDEVATHADTLYILGDFLEYWIGDDDRAEGLEPAFSALRRLSQHGTEILFMHGNRDFLVGEELAQRCHFQLVHEPLVTPVNDTPTLLMHGDVLCTDDVEYQQFRRMVRDKHWQSELLKKTLGEREQIAKSLRETSRKATADKPEDIMDVNQHTVVETMLNNSVYTLIHGHTHRPAIHDFDIDGHPARRIVLGDWYQTGNYLKINENAEPELVSFS